MISEFMLTVLRLSTGFQKTNTFKYSEIVDERCAELLRDDPNSPLQYFVRQTRLWERVVESIAEIDRRDGYNAGSLGSELELQVHLDQLESYKHMAPNYIRNTGKSIPDC